MRSYFLLVFFFFTTTVCSQNPGIDSLKKVFALHSNDTVGLYALSKVASLYLDSSDFNNSIKTANQAIDLAKKLKDNNILGEMYALISGCYGKQNNVGDAISYGFKALKYFEITGNLKQQAGILQRIGVYNHNMLKGEEALSFYKRAYQLRIQAKDTFGIAQSGNTIGLMLIDRGQFDSAKVLFNQALVLYAAVVDSNNGAFPFTYNCFGILYQGIAGKYMEEGKSEPVNKNLREALKYFMRAEEGWKRAKMPMGLVESRLNQANMRMVLLEYKEARAILNSAINVAMHNEKEYTTKLRSAYMYLSDLEYRCGNYKAAYEAHETFMDYYSRVQNDENNRKNLQSRMQYEFDKKDVIAKAEQERKDALTKAEISKQKVVRNFSVGSAFAVLFFGGFAFYNFRKRKKLENQQALADERLRISRDLHDDMGASLSSISVFSSAVKQKLLNNETLEAEQLLDRMSTDAQEMVSGMSEMVWTISPHNDTIEKLTDRLQLYAAGMLSAKNISFSLECDEELKNRKLPVDMRKNIFLILKEAINNAAKYSGATDVKLTVSKMENRMVAVLADNGKGFDISDQGNKNGKAGNGLKNMHQRADEIQSQLEIISEINKGTSMELICTI